MSWDISWRVSQQPRDSGEPARGKKAKIILSLVMNTTASLLLLEALRPITWYDEVLRIR